MTDTTDDGGPAHPGEIGFGCMHDNMHQTGTSVAQWYGMSLRDHFAGMAMQALVGAAADYSLKGGRTAPDENCTARAAYDMAAAMLRARNTT